MPIKRALVVDDSKAAGLALRRMLEKQHSLVVDMAESAEAALKYLRTEKPDLIFMDHIMPGMNGLDAVKAINANPQTATIPVVMYTSTEGPAYPAKARAYGAAGVLPKPPKAELLAQFIRQLGVAAERAEPQPAAVAAPAAASPAPPPPAIVSAEAMERIARAAAESVLGDGLRSLVARMMDEQLAQFRNDLLTSSENAAKQAATELHLAQVSDLESQLRQQVHEQLAEMNTRPAEQAIDPTVLEEIVNATRSVVAQDAMDVARQTAQDVARDTLIEAARRTAGETARQIAGDVAAARVTGLVEQLRKDVRDQLAEMNARLAEPKPLDAVALEEVKKLARSTAAQESADMAAITAQKVAHQYAAEIARDTARQAAGELYATRADTLTNELRKYMDNQLAALKATLDASTTVPPAVLAEVKNVARTAAGQRGAESAQQAVQQLAQQSAQEIGKHAARVAARQLENAMVTAEREQTMRMVIFAGAAAFVGVFASFIVYLLR